MSIDIILESCLRTGKNILEIIDACCGIEVIWSKYKEHKLVVLHEEVLPVSDIRQLQEYKVLMIQLGCYN